MEKSRKRYFLWGKNKQEAIINNESVSLQSNSSGAALHTEKRYKSTGVFSLC